MIVVTGGAGFIGSNIVKGLNECGRRDVIVVDDLTEGRKFTNLVNADIADYWDKDQFLSRLMQKNFSQKIEAIFHQGACSTTTEWNGKFMMETNFEYSKILLHEALLRKIPFIYASSAAVYGRGQVFKEEKTFEAPLNVYGYSKFLFDQYVRAILPKANSQIVGLRYFNVYGPRERHKGSMASVAFHLYHQALKEGVVKLFEGCEGYADGEQKRDFIFVEDAVKVNLWFWQHPEKSGIFNCGTGCAESFNAVAKAVIQFRGQGKIQYIPFPENLKGCYQSYTQADISALRGVGYPHAFRTVSEGVQDYMQWLSSPES